MPAPAPYLGELEQVVLRALQKDPAKRYQTMSELRTVLKRALESELKRSTKAGSGSFVVANPGSTQQGAARSTAARTGSSAGGATGGASSRRGSRLLGCGGEITHSGQHPPATVLPPPPRMAPTIPTAANPNMGTTVVSEQTKKKAMGTRAIRQHSRNRW